MTYAPPWDAPVVAALGEIEKLPGFAPDDVRWDNFYYVGYRGPMEQAAISAYLPAEEQTDRVRFSVSFDQLKITDSQDHQLNPSGVARILDVPAASALKAITMLAPALLASLGAYHALLTTRAGLWMGGEYGRNPERFLHPADSFSHPPDTAEPIQQTRDL